MQTGFNYQAFLSSDKSEEDVIELLSRTPDLPTFWGLRFSADILSSPVATLFEGFSYDLLSDHEFARTNKAAGIPSDKVNILILADKSSLATLWLIEKVRELNPSTNVFVIGSNKLGIKGQQKKIDREIGPTETINSAASCRIFAVKGENPPDAKRFHAKLDIEYFDSPLYTLPGVFSQKRLDPGTQLLLDSIADMDFNSKTVWDLGCGSGVIGLKALQQNAAKVYSTDLSLQAVQNTQLQFEAFKIDSEKFETLWSCADSHLPEQQFEFILTNPPYHVKSSMRTDIVDYWSEVTAKKLTEQGELILVHNRFLPYEKKLTDYFSRVSIINENKEYVVLHAFK